MANAKLVSTTGVVGSDVELNNEIFGAEVHKQALFDAINLQRAAVRLGQANVKHRHDVRGGGAKPWRQKGTGRARIGTIRAPHWVGGGVVFGPEGRKYSFKLNRKVRKLALRSALSSKVASGSLFVLDGAFNIETPKAKEVRDFVKGLGNKTLFIDTEISNNVDLCFRNFYEMKVDEASKINVLDIVSAKAVVLTSEAVKQIEEALA